MNRCSSTRIGNGILKRAGIEGASGRSAFTLIELLVVIAIIGMLLAIITPALKVAKDKARELICKSNLHQWGVVFLTYTQENEDKFWIENNVWLTGEKQGGWMPYLSSIYGDTDKLRLCPAATKANGPTGGIGTTTARWGGEIMVMHQFGDDPEKNYGSYGTNLWINRVTAAQPGWRGRPDRQWQTTLVKESTSSIPMVFDCVWFGSNPISIYEGNGGMYAPAIDFWEGLDPLVPGNWDRDMGRLTLDRHGKAINMTLMDGSTEKVKLNDLWSFNWHRDYERQHDVEIPWLPK